MRTKNSTNSFYGQVHDMALLAPSLSRQLGKRKYEQNDMLDSIICVMSSFV